MCAIVRSQRIELLLTVLAGCIGLTSCGQSAGIAQVDHSQKSELANDVELSQMMRWEAELNSRLDRLGPFKPSEGRDRYGAHVRASIQFFAERFPKGTGAEKELLDVVIASNDSENSPFLNIAVSELIDRLASNDDREELTRLLSSRCPERVGIHLSIEAELIILKHEVLDDGTLLLCDVYEQSQREDVRATVAEAVRRGFRFAGIVDQDDDELMRHCRQWYEMNRESLEPNMEYLHHLIMGSFPYEQQGVLRFVGSDSHK